MTDTSHDPVLHRYLVARQEIREADDQWWVPWLGKAKTLRALRALFEFADRLNDKYEEMRAAMADSSQVLNQVADGLRNLAPHLTTLLAERNALAAENASLKGEDAAESAAADNVKGAFDSVAGLFDQTDEAPTPEPLPETAAESTPDDAA